jgi:hypothetical protein
VSSLGDAASEYAARGWPVFPLRPSAKTPATTHGVLDASTDPERVSAWWADMPDANIGLATGFVFDVLDLDSVDAAVVFRGWCTDQDIDPFDLRRAVVKTFRGWHYFLAACGIGNRTRLLGADIDWRGKGGYVVAPPSVHPSGHPYMWSVRTALDNGEVLPEVPDALRLELDPPPPTPPPALPAVVNGGTATAPTGYADAALRGELDRMRAATEGERNATLFAAAANVAELVNTGLLGPNSFSDLAVAAHAVGLGQTEIGRTIRSAKLKTADKVRVITTVSDPNGFLNQPLRAKPNGVLEHGSTDDDDGQQHDDEPELPTLDGAALHGLVGEAVRALDPWTEGAPAAVLACLLAGVGVCIGPVPHAVVSTSSHRLLIWPLLLGRTSTGRKGTAQDVAEAILGAADPSFVLDNMTGGLSSGEGIIELVRDPTIVDDPETGEPKIITAGVEDKRRYIIETEYGGTIARARREGSSLSAIMRQAWDGKKLSTLTKARVSATGAHIAIAAHITPGEFMRRLDDRDVLGGTYNRFLPILASRSKLLPHAAPPPADLLEDLGARLRVSMVRARQTLTVISRTPEAAAMWEEIYRELSSRSDDDDRLASFIARAVPYCVRLSALYAAIDGSPHVEPMHLRAGAAMVRYSIESVERLLLSPADRRVNRLITALRAAGNTGLTRTELRDIDGLHPTAADFDVLLSKIPRLRKQREATGGRPTERYLLPAPLTRENSAQSPVE